MLQHRLQHLISVFQAVNEEPQKSLYFYTGAFPPNTRTIQPPPDIKWRLFVDSLYHFEMHQHEADIKVIDEVLDVLNNHYQQRQHFCWRSHEHHFHVDLEEYVNCPVTCLYEIEEFLEKLHKELYAI